jgi:hypothetical protein
MGCFCPKGELLVNENYLRAGQVGVVASVPGRIPAIQARHAAEDGGYYNAVIPVCQ